ncbi:MAG TPA: hypothetical protein VK927_07270, partial [Adhaeribacter sp.]|nr:hypothetical protein [Adhaeribacter sp.]
MKKALFVAIILFLSLNLIAAFHAYRFTHFATEANAKTAHPMQLSGFGKLKTLLFGVKNPRP